MMLHTLIRRTRAAPSRFTDRLRRVLIAIARIQLGPASGVDCPWGMFCPRRSALDYCFGQQPQDWIARPGAWEATAATEGTNETAIREPAGRLDTGRTSSRIGSPAPRGRVWKRGSASESWIVNGACRYGKTWPEKLRASTAFSPCFAYLNFPEWFNYSLANPVTGGQVLGNSTPCGAEGSQTRSLAGCPTRLFWRVEGLPFKVTNSA
jgi:hypothetical protein